VQRDDGTGVATTVEVEVTHASTGQLVSTAKASTNDRGLAHVRVPYDVGGELGLNLPGEHDLAVSAQADSRPGAPVQDTEPAAAALDYRIQGPVGDG
jgi:hypothetical protein